LAFGADLAGFSVPKPTPSNRRSRPIVPHLQRQRRFHLRRRRVVHHVLPKEASGSRARSAIGSWALTHRTAAGHRLHFSGAGHAGTRSIGGVAVLQVQQGGTGFSRRSTWKKSR
jgi:hypothetical protein